MHQLTPESVGPTILVERTDDGLVREATVCMLSKVELWIDLGGNLLQSPLTNTRVELRSSEAERYERMTRIDMLKGGMIPVECCPYTLKFEDTLGVMNGGRPVKLPEGMDPPQCAGRKLPPGTTRFDIPLLDFRGCEHMEALIKKRRENAARKAAEAGASTTLLAQAEAMGRGIAQGLTPPGRGAPKSEPDAPRK
jgi:hypothetical protein